MAHTLDGAGSSGDRGNRTLPPRTHRVLPVHSTGQRRRDARHVATLLYEVARRDARMYRSRTPGTHARPALLFAAGNSHRQDPLFCVLWVDFVATSAGPAGSLPCPSLV